jgi:hypothetical protein
VPCGRSRRSRGLKSARSSRGAIVGLHVDKADHALLDFGPGALQCRADRHYSPQRTGDKRPSTLLGRARVTGFASLEEILTVRVDEAMIREHRKMARLIGDMALGLNEARAARQRVHAWSAGCRTGVAAGRDSGRQDTRRQRVALDGADSSGPTNAGSRSPETVDAAVAGRPPLGLHNRAE